MPVGRPPVRNCVCWSATFPASKVRGNEGLTIACQAKYEDSEERLDNADSKDEDSTLEESHLDFDLVMYLAKSGSGVRLLRVRCVATSGVNRRRSKMQRKTLARGLCCVSLPSLLQRLSESSSRIVLLRLGEVWRIDAGESVATVVCNTLVARHQEKINA
jgi:hypothetical protein